MRVMSKGIVEKRYMSAVVSTVRSNQERREKQATRNLLDHLVFIVKSLIDRYGAQLVNVQGLCAAPDQELDFFGSEERQCMSTTDQVESAAERFELLYVIQGTE